MLSGLIALYVEVHPVDAARLVCRRARLERNAGKTNSSVHRNTPSPQSRVGLAGAYRVMLRIRRAVEKLWPPSVERARPFWKFGFERERAERDEHVAIGLDRDVAARIDLTSFDREIAIGH